MKYMIFVAETQFAEPQPHYYPTIHAAMLAAQGFQIAGGWVQYGPYLCKALNDRADRQLARLIQAVKP